ncbi:DUF1292 domain-containing protein [Caminicella sporogenes]|uniref:DUF1292 domain-containing protein n=1 Tax=Caminicella sporogenes TaxID=166485 RepID=UPI002541FD09|nr:DUF1292 domain-containing protein [Caminicella sporogenes]WIF94496.1 DUF1292 domain-containing protein [Caminicella sporogenes]
MENEKIITLIDEENNEKEFEIIATLEVENKEYAILLPLDEDTEEAVVFKIVEENGEEMLECVEDDNEFNKVAKAYEEMMEK